jgi:hypothetical protein
MAVGDLAIWHLPLQLAAKPHPTEQTIAHLPFARLWTHSPKGACQANGGGQLMGPCVCVRPRNATYQQLSLKGLRENPSLRPAARCNLKLSTLKTSGQGKAWCQINWRKK